MRTVFAHEMLLTKPGASAEAVFLEVMQHLQSWVAHKIQVTWRSKHREDPTLAITVGDSSGVVEKPEIGHRVKIISKGVPGAAKDIYCLEWEHPHDNDPTLTWNLLVTLARAENRVELDIRARIVSAAATLRPVELELGRPRIIGELLKLFDASIEGWPIQKTPDFVAPTEIPMFVDAVLNNRSRSLPLVLISARNYDDRFLVNPDLLLRTLQGFAHVAALNNKWASFRLRDQIGQAYACFDGAVRLYWPGFSVNDEPWRHHLFTPADIHNLKERLGLKIFGHIAPVTSFRFSDSVTARIVRHALQEEDVRQITALRKQATGLTEKDSLIETQQSKIQSLQDEIETLNRELETQRKQWAEYGRSTLVATPAPTTESATEPEEEMPPTTVSEAFSRAKRDFGHGGVLMFSDRAEKSAAESPYQEPDRVYALFQAIHAIASEWKEKGGALGQTWEEAFRAQDIATEYKSHISQTATGKWSDDYKMDYKGKKVLLEHHITLGAKQAQKCLSIHWYRDDELKTLIIGHCGRHLSNTST